MNDDEYGEFAKAMDGLSQYFQKTKLTDMAVTLYFDALQQYSFSDIKNAITLHIKDAEAGKFYPKVGDLIKKMDGGEITVDIIVASAKLRDTPLGCAAHAMIGTWNLDNLSSFDLRQLAQQCMPKIAEWKQGQYSDHEISVMLKHDVNPAGPIAKGVMTSPDNAPELLQRAERIAATPKHLLNLEAPYQDPEGEMLPVDVMKYLEHGANK